MREGGGQGMGAVLSHVEGWIEARSQEGVGAGWTQTDGK